MQPLFGGLDSLVILTAINIPDLIQKSNPLISVDLD